MLNDKASHTPKRIFKITRALGDFLARTAHEQRMTGGGLDGCLRNSQSSADLKTDPHRVKGNMHRICGFLIFCAATSFAAERGESSDLTNRIEALERQQEEYFRQVTESRHVNSFFQDHLTIGGFFEPGISLIGGPDTATQAMTASNLFGLNFSSEFKKNLRFAAQFITGLNILLGNPHNDPRAERLGLPKQRSYSTPSIGSLVAQAYLEYGVFRNNQVQVGMGYAPYGNSFQQREPVLFIRRGGPQMTRQPNLVGPLWTGIHFYGTDYQPQFRWGYNFYTFTAATNFKVPGVGAHFWWTPNDDRLTAGISSQMGKDGSLTYENFGADLKFKISPVTITTEYTTHIIPGEDPWSIYVEPSISIFQEDWILYVFGDYANNPQNQTGTGATALADPYQKLEYGGGVNWLPTAYTRLRCGLTLNDYRGSTATIDRQNRDYWSLDLSAGVAF